MKYFSDCQMLQDLKQRYRELALQYHPDTGGNEETFKTIQAEFEQALRLFMQSAFTDFGRSTGKTAYGSSHVFADILAKIISWNIEIEIIGYWIYCFKSYAYKEQLRNLGFWFSKKHRAWVFNGGTKKKLRSKFTLDDIKSMHGVEYIRDQEEQELLPI